MLMVDGHLRIYSAARRLPELDAALIMRGEVEVRRNFDLARKLFHTLTWKEFPPKHIRRSLGFRRKLNGTYRTFADAVLIFTSVVLIELPIIGFQGLFTINNVDFAINV